MTEPPVLELPVHTAPLGLAFYDGQHLPGEYHGDLFVALHGPVRQTHPAGHSLVRVPIRDGQPQPAVEVVRGWRVGDESWGRPVAPYAGRDSALYLTDDTAGLAYRLSARAGGS